MTRFDLTNLPSMSHLVKPVIKSLYEKYVDNYENTVITDVFYLQVGRVSRDNSLRVADGEFTIPCVLGSAISRTGFGSEINRIVRIDKCRLGILNNAEKTRPYLRVESWSDAGPGTPMVKLPPSILVSDFSENKAPTTASKSPSTTSATSVPRTCNPIESISPFINKFTFLARASKKSDVREYTSKQSNDKGRLFNCTFTDETGDIKATGFNDSVDKFYDQIIDGQQYYVSEMDVRKANPRFNTTSHDFELFFTADTKIEPAYDAKVALPTVFFKFVPSIADLSDLPIDSTVDVAGIATRIGDTQVITSKSSNIPYTKRDITIADDSGMEIELTLWGVDAEEFNHPVGTVVAVKGARLGEFRGRTLSATRSSQVVIDPDEKTAHKLKGWWRATSGTGVEFTRVGESEQAKAKESKKSPRYTVNKVLTERHGMSDQAEFFEVKARVSTIFTRNVAYPSCTNGDCRKKVTNMGMEWRCEKCEVNIQEPAYRYLLTMIVSDVSSEETGLQVSVFDEVGRTLYGDKAAEFQLLLENGGDGFNIPLSNALKEIQGEEYIWNIKASLDMYQGQERARYNALSVRKPDPITEGSRLLSELGF